MRQLAEASLMKSYDHNKPNYILVGLEKLFFKVYRRLVRCDKCQALGLHSSVRCRSNNSFCTNCGRKDCHSQRCNSPPCCKNCSDFNNIIRSSVPFHTDPRDTNPAASDPACPTYKAALSCILQDKEISLFGPNPNQSDRDVAQVRTSLTQTGSRGPMVMNHPPPSTSSSDLINTSATRDSPLPTITITNSSLARKSNDFLSSCFLPSYTRSQT